MLERIRNQITDLRKARGRGTARRGSSPDGSGRERSGSCSRVPIKQYLQKLPKWGRFGVTSVTPFLLLPVHPEGCTPAHRT